MNCPDVVRAAIALRLSHPTAPAGDVLAIVLQDAGGDVADFGPALVAGEAFALLVAEAIDGVEMMPAWRQWGKVAADPVLASLLNERWDHHILPSFAARYGLTASRRLTTVHTIKWRPRLVL